jgi:Icc protein
MTETPEQAGRALRLVQISDTHLGEEPNSELLGMDTDASLEHVLQMLQQHPEQPDLILVTGDIGDNGTLAAYERFHARMGALNIPSLWLVGNHDMASRLRNVVGDGPELTRRLQLGGWQILMLETAVPGQVGGALPESEMAFLRHSLAATPEIPTLIALHHQPVAVGSAWLDEQQVQNGEAFLALLADYPQVKAVVWGHVHQDFEREINGARFMSAPSTCVQFAPQQEDFKVDDLPPGLRWIDLMSDGSITTEVQRLEGVALTVDLESSGYAN